MSKETIKKWLSIEDQIQLLKDRNLIIEDEIYSKNILSRISYYRLISYRFPFCNENDKNLFKDDAKFEDLVNLYNKDSKYQALLYQVLKEIEVLLRTQLIYWFSQKDLWFYKDKKHFNFLGEEANKKKNSYMKQVNNSVYNDKNIHIHYYIEQHDKNEAPYKSKDCKHDYKATKLFCDTCKKNKDTKEKFCKSCNVKLTLKRLCNCYPQAWVALESFDFGMLIDLYSGLNGFIKNDFNIGNDLSKYLDSESQFSKFFSIDSKYLLDKNKKSQNKKSPLLDLLQDVKRIRNIVAHHDKIIGRYSFKESKSIIFLKRYYKDNNDIKNLLVKEINTINSKKSSTFLPYFLVIKYFLDILFKKENNLGDQDNIFTEFLELSKDAFYNKSLSLDELPEEFFEPARENTRIVD